MFEKILVPVDGSEQGFKALELACGLAKDNEDTIILILSVFKHLSFSGGSLSLRSGTGTDAAENMEDVLGAYAREVVAEGKKIAASNGIDSEHIRGFMRQGHVDKEILKFADKQEVDLIVIGKQGQNFLKGCLLGGTAHNVSGLSKRPVLVV